MTEWIKWINIKCSVNVWVMDGWMDGWVYSYSRVRDETGEGNGDPL